ncbi:Cytosolic carboxypeptidase 6 [Platysternon megacephalum]|uniref:Cytosolic carboxypeptidase 6 n=1 Tax=Platysternon megacephalum TaxID=55544 RepID=A0A4D9EVQ7_9SAUR|nr:Cytosolic carboxypeptidase 6 [Platysternon megacephalum]
MVTVLQTGQRLPPKNVYYYRCPDHRKNYVMSFAFCFDREDDVYQFAYCYPYTYTRLRHYLDNLQRRNMDYFYRELLGLSVFSEECYVKELALIA